MSQVLYRKYRPKTFQDIVGQEHIVQTLKNAIEMSNVAHAYLFSGPRGTGKTTMARVFAKALNCKEAKGANVCLNCVVCEGIEKGNFIDLIEIDAASNRGIDEIRQLKDAVRFAPSLAEHKVYIIDEVHMLTKEAFNALLKTLEEPPAHTIFILATTEPHKVLSTIVSRCQSFNFGLLSNKHIQTRLKTILKNEKRNLDNDSVALVVSSAAGSMRDAESLLGKVLAMDVMEPEELRVILGVSDTQTVIELFDCLLSAKREEALEFLMNLVQGGCDIEQFIKISIDYARILMYMKMNIKAGELMASNLSKQQIEQAKKQVNSLTENKIYSIIKALLQARQDIKFSPIPNLPLELAVIKIIGEGSMLKN